MPQDCYLCGRNCLALLMYIVYFTYSILILVLSKEKMRHSFLKIRVLLYFPGCPDKIILYSELKAPWGPGTFQPGKGLTYHLVMPSQGWNSWGLGIVPSEAFKSWCLKLISWWHGRPTEMRSPTDSWEERGREAEKRSEAALKSGKRVSRKLSQFTPFPSSAQRICNVQK